MGEVKLYTCTTKLVNSIAHNANRIRKAIIRQKRPMASERANPRMAYVNSCCFRDGLRAYPMIKLPKTVPIPAPEPASPTVAAPAPMNFAAASTSRWVTDVWKPRLTIWLTSVSGLVAVVQLPRPATPLYDASVLFELASVLLLVVALSGLTSALEFLATKDCVVDAQILAQPYILSDFCFGRQAKNLEKKNITAGLQRF